MICMYFLLPVIPVNFLVQNDLVLYCAFDK